MIDPKKGDPTDKMENRALRNLLSATAMLGHLCALYDSGVFEAGRLMSNLLFQLSIKRKSNTPLLAQTNMIESFRVTVDVETTASSLVTNPSMSPLVNLMFGFKQDRFGQLQPAASWLPAFATKEPAKGFASLGLERWLDDPIIPTSERTLSRRELITYVRNKDGGAHCDPDGRLLKSAAYVDLVNSFPISKHSAIEGEGTVTLPWNLLPPVTMPILRQIAHEMLSAIYSQSDVREYLYLPSLVCIFDGDVLKGSLVPEKYPYVGEVYGARPVVVRRPLT